MAARAASPLLARPMAWVPGAPATRDFGLRYATRQRQPSSRFHLVPARDGVLQPAAQRLGLAARGVPHIVWALRLHPVACRHYNPGPKKSTPPSQGRRGAPRYHPSSPDAPGPSCCNGLTRSGLSRTAPRRHSRGVAQGTSHPTSSLLSEHSPRYSSPSRPILLASIIPAVATLSTRAGPTARATSKSGETRGMQGVEKGSGVFRPGVIGWGHEGASTGAGVARTRGP